MNHLKFFLPFVLMLTVLGGCSLFSKRKTAEEANVPSNKHNKISKIQYDELMKKYDVLLEKYQALNRDRSGESGIEEEKDLLRALGKKDDGAALTETVNVFGNNGLASRKGQIEILSENGQFNSVSSRNRLEGQIGQLRRGSSFLSTGDYDQAMKIFKTLENSPIRQIQVRAKYSIGELLFRQKDYDLAMQVFEDVIKEYAFSGVVLKTLGRLVVCSEKLKLLAQKDKYYSILHDFFGGG